MSILSGKKIEKEVAKGHIYISDFDHKRVNPNSYNLRLGDKLGIYDNGYLDCKKQNTITLREIPEDGYMLFPGTLYLAETKELTFTDKYVPMLEGRSSVGRLGIMIHATAGFGDIGFKGVWTLEISVVQPVRIYAGMDICQIYYHTIEGPYDLYGSNGGKYNNNLGLEASKLYLDFN